MSAKCVYVKSMYEKCKREKGVCRMKKRLLEECHRQKLYFTGPHYKLRHMWLNDTHKSRDASCRVGGENT